MEIATIGFTRSSARSFFERITGFQARTVLDVRLHNTSQLAGFAKRDDLAYLVQTICSAGYVEVPDLTKQIGWDEYATAYLHLLAERRIESTLDRAAFDRGVLLCSEATPDHCHRRIAAEYLQGRWGDVTIRHL
jgi:uncharacterized protein (DUF488 family)